METVKVPLGSSIAEFRLLNWQEQASLSFHDGKDVRRTILSAALVNIPSREDASRIMEALPGKILDTVWMLYRAGLPRPRLFTTQALYTPPEASAFWAKAREEAKALEDSLHGDD